MKMKWPGFNKKGTVVISLSTESFCIAENTIELYGDTFTPKDELHVTLLGAGLATIILDKILQNKKINKLLEKEFEDIDWSYSQTGPVHILSRKKEKIVQKSIIMLVEMHGVIQFYDRLKMLGLIGIDTPVPPSHITMYTHNCPLGIGVPDKKTLNFLTTKILPVNILNKYC